MSSANPQPEADQQMLSQRAQRQNPHRSQPNPSWDLHSLKLSSQIQSSPDKGPSELWAAEAWRACSALEAVRSHSARLPFIRWGCPASWVAPHTQQTLHTQEGTQGSGVHSSGAEPPPGEVRIPGALTVLAGADGYLDDGVADVRGGLALREHILRRPGQGDVQ